MSSSAVQNHWLTARRRVAHSAAAGLLIAATWAVVFPSWSGATDSHSVTFTTTSGIQSATGHRTFTVPAGVTTLRVQVTGAGGGGTFQGIDQSSVDETPGGNGATVTANVSVTPGEVLTIVLGHAGQNGTRGSSGSGVSGVGGEGFGNGGPGGTVVGNALGAGGGGGASAILTGSTALVVAGAGGGASGAIPLQLGSPLNYFWPVCSWATTHTSTVGGWTTCSSTPAGPTPSTPLESTVGCPGLDATGPGATPAPTCPFATVTDGSHAGHAGSDAIATDTAAFPPGGGGGGGWVGGAGGIASSVPLLTGGGQGGSSFTDQERTSSVTVTSAANAGATGIEKFCPVGSAIATAASTTTTQPAPPCSPVATQAGDGTITISYGGDKVAVLDAHASAEPGSVVPTTVPTVATTPVTTDPAGLQVAAEPARPIVMQPSYAG